jgi:hypothetical protein
LKSHVVFLNFFTDETAVGSRLESALECDVGGGTTHNSDEMVQVLGAQAILHQVSNFFGVSLCGCIESERDLNVLILKISVDSFRSSNHTALRVVLGKIFTEEAGIGV